MFTASPYSSLLKLTLHCTFHMFPRGQKQVRHEVVSEGGTNPKMEAVSVSYHKGLISRTGIDLKNLPLTVVKYILHNMWPLVALLKPEVMKTATYQVENKTLIL